jgi:hypothetical protein
VPPNAVNLLGGLSDISIDGSIKNDLLADDGIGYWPAILDKEIHNATLRDERSEELSSLAGGRHE